MEPAERDQVVGIGSAPFGPGCGVVDLEPVPGRAALDRATDVAVQHEASQPAWHVARPPSQAERGAVLSQPHHLDDSVAEDLMKGSGAEAWPSQHRDPGLAAVDRHHGCTAVGLDRRGRLGTRDLPLADRCAIPV